MPNSGIFLSGAKMLKEHFVNEHNKMQETRNNSFGSKKRNTIICQAKQVSVRTVK